MPDLRDFRESTAWKADFLIRPAVPHRGHTWPPDGGDPFAVDHDETRALYYARSRPSLTFRQSETPDLGTTAEAIPMGYTVLRLLEKIAVASPDGLLRVWPHEATAEEQSPPYLQQYQAILPGDRYLDLGLTWPVRFALDDATELAARTHTPVLVTRVLRIVNWH